MKKALALALSLTMMVSLFAGCGSKDSGSTNANTNTNTSSGSQQEELPSYSFQLGFNTVEDSVPGETAPAFAAYVNAAAGKDRLHGLHHSRRYCHV